MKNIENFKGETKKMERTVKCGLEDRLPRHMSLDRPPRCYDSRDCDYNFLFRPLEKDSYNICMYTIIKSRYKKEDNNYGRF